MDWELAGAPFTRSTTLLWLAPGIVCAAARGFRIAPDQQIQSRQEEQQRPQIADPSDPLGQERFEQRQQSDQQNKNPREAMIEFGESLVGFQLCGIFRDCLRRGRMLMHLGVIHLLWGGKGRRRCLPQEKREDGEKEWFAETVQVRSHGAPKAGSNDFATSLRPRRGRFPHRGVGKILGVAGLSRTATHRL